MRQPELQLLSTAVKVVTEVGEDGVARSVFVHPLVERSLDTDARRTAAASLLGWQELAPIARWTAHIDQVS